MITKINLLHYRNHVDKVITFTKDTNIIVGANGSGKTNILEAITLLSGAKSHKAITDVELVHLDKQFARIDGQFDNEVTSTIILQKHDKSARIKKQYFINQIKKTQSAFNGVYRSVMFSPEDIKLVAGSPTRRRNYIDRILSMYKFLY